MNKVQKYMKETVAELSKMTWPTKDELTGSTIITIVFSIIMAIFIGIVDKILGIIVQSIFDINA